MFEDAIIVASHSRVLIIERFDIDISFPWTTFESLREAESCDPIDHSEVHCFCYTSFLARYHAIFWKEELRGARMDIFSLFECFEEIGFTGEPCKNSYLYL